MWYDDKYTNKGRYMTVFSKSPDSAQTDGAYIARLATAVLAITLFVCIILGFSLYRSYLMHKEQAAVTSRNLVLSLRNNIDEIFNKVDIALFAIMEEVTRQRTGTGIDKHTVNEYLARTLSRLPYLEGLRVADEHGTVAYGVDPSAPVTNNSDREYFTYLRDNPGAGLAISKPLISRTTNKWVIVCARRLNQPDGSFGGIVYAVFGLEQLTRMFSSLDMGKHGIVTLFNTDMSIDVRYPELSGAGSGEVRSLKNSTVHRLIQAGKNRGTFITHSPLDGIERTLSYQKISDKPLYILIGVATTDYLDPWRKEATILGGMSALLLLLTVGTSWFMYNNRKRRSSYIEALMNSETRYRTLFDSAGDGILILDADGSIQGANEIICMRLGYREEEFLGKSPAHFVAPEYVKHVPERMSLIEKNGSAIFETIHISKEGIRIPTEISARIIDFGGKQMVMSIARDITKRKNIEEKLEREKEFSISALNTLPGVFYIFDSSLTLLRWNENLEKVTEYSSDEISRMSPLDLFSGKDKDLVRERIQNVFVEGEASVEADLVSKNGTTIPYYLNGRTIEIDGRSCLIGMGIDITERKSIEEERQKYFLFIESLLKHSPLGIRVFDGESGACVLVNQAAADIAGGSVEAMQEQNFRELSSWRSCGLLEIGESVITDGTGRMVEANMLTSFGKRVSVAYMVAKFVVKDKPYLLVVGRDISEEKRLAEENRNIEAQMRHVQKLESLGVLAGGIAHDFNNILLAILGNAELALLRMNPESPARNNLHQIEKSAQRAADLAQQMLAYSGKGQFVIEPLDINALITEMNHMLEVSISKKVVMRMDLAEDVRLFEGDATQIRQIIMNLVINASEAIGDENGTITITTGSMNCDRSYLSTIWLYDSLAEGTYIYFEITDTGCGMDRETLAKLFDPFFTTKFTGRGLGMAAVLGIVRGHRGAINVYSEPGKGTSFKVLLPARQNIPGISHQESSYIQPTLKGSGTILLVDDEETILELGRDMLGELGYQVLTAENGVVALEVFREHRDEIACVILDLTMPRLDGEQTFRELQRLEPDIKVIISSGYNEQEVSHKFAHEEPAGFIQKPYRLSELSRKLQEVV